MFKKFVELFNYKENMIDISNGFVKISNELTVFPGYSFEQFKNTRFYNNQDGIKIIYLNEKQIINNRKYIVNLFFRSGKIYMVSLICCDIEFNERDEKKRKELHDATLMELGIDQYMKYNWGTISSDYDVRSNLSSINITFF
jgi:hypothetical protein